MQMEAAECGAAALAMVLGYHGRYVQLAQLRVDCGVSRDGSKASNMLKAARRYGLKAKGFSKGLESLKKVRLPCIIFWEFNHFVVLEGFTEKSVLINDPAIGHRRMSWSEFSDGFTGVVLAFEPGEDFVKAGSLPNPLPALWERTRGSRKALAFAAACGLLGVVPGVTQAAFTRIIIDSVIVDMRFDWLRPLLVIMAGLTLFQLVLDTLKAIFFRRLEMGLSAKLNAEFYRHLIRLPYQFYCQRYVGEVVDRAGVNDMIVGLLSGQLTQCVIGMFTMVMFGAVLFSYSIELTLVGMIATWVDFALVQLVTKRRQEANLRIAKQGGKVQAATIAGITSIDTLKASGLENSFFETWAGFFAAASNSRLELALESRWFSVLPTLTGSIISTTVLLVGGYRVMNGEMTFGTLMAFNALMSYFLAPVNQLLGLATQLQVIRGNLTRLDDVMEYPEHHGFAEGSLVDEVEEATGPGPRTEGAGDAKVRLEGKIVCRGISYGYSPLGKPMIEGFDFEVRPGERVALVGGSGSGKSTMARIVAGLIVPWEGEVLLDGSPRDELPRDLIVHSVALIEQDFALFPGTVRDNLTLWDPTIPDEWLIEACRDACILDDVMALPGGFSASLLERGSNLSGGQRQRLEIARALVRNPSVLIMDEATSALDAATEAEVMENVRRRGCTVLVVAHRLSTIRDCSQIFVMQRGKVVEHGTHRELWAAQDAYAALLRKG
jgi:ATP-binding cassette subfamily C protein